MTETSINQNKLLIRRQLINDIYELDLELSSLHDIIQMKRFLLQKMEDDELRRSEASQHLTLLPDCPIKAATRECADSGSSFSTKSYSVRRDFALVEASGSH